MQRCTVHDSSKTVPFILEQTGFMRVHITGSSMEPTIRRNDVIEVRRTDGILPGNCYLFLFNGVLLLHRCISCTKTIGYFMGDSSGSIEAVVHDSVLGEFNDPHSRFFCRAVTLLNSLSACPYRDEPHRMPRFINRARINTIRLMHRVDGIFYQNGRLSNGEPMEKKRYEKPAIHTEDVSTAFAGACCTQESPVGWNPNMLSPACRLPGCHLELNSYNASG